MPTDRLGGNSYRLVESNDSRLLLTGPKGPRKWILFLRQPENVYSVHVRTRKFRNLAKTKRYVVPAPRANSKTQGGTRIDSDSICHRHHSVFGFSNGLSI